MAFDQTFSQYLNKTTTKDAEPSTKLHRRRRSARVFKAFLKLSSNSPLQHPDFVSSSPPSTLPTMPPTSTLQEQLHFDDLNSLVSSSSGSPDLATLPPTVQSDDGAIPRRSSSLHVSDASPSSLKGTMSPESRKLHSTPPYDSESSYASSDNGKSSNYAPIFLRKKGLSRSSSRRAVKILFKKQVSFNEKTEEVNVERATCSSTIKDSRFPPHVELESGQMESERVSAYQVCPYHHCSLNGHCQDPPLPKKPFLRRKRPSSEPSKVGKRSGASTMEEKRSALKKKGTKKHQTGSDAKSSVWEGSLRKSQRNAPSDAEIQRLGLRERGTNADKLKDLDNSSQEPEPKFGNGKPLSMWHLIHKHMVSTLAADERKPLPGADENKQVEDSETVNTSGIPDFSPDISESNVGTSYSDEESQDVEINKLFAVKLVREAIEKILLPEVHDQHSESQSISGDSVEGHLLPEKNHQEDNNEGFHAETANVQGCGEANITREETKKAESKWGKRADKKSPSNWSNIRKWILLQRFVKEVEKVRQLNYRSPRTLQLKDETQAERISLKPHTLDEKRRGEEWMLDYALQQVISQLAPTQRRKVALLVQAFETIVPPQEDGTMEFTSKENESVSREEGLNALGEASSKWDDSKISNPAEHHDSSDGQNLAVDSCQESSYAEEVSGSKTELSSSNEEINVAGPQVYTSQLTNFGTELISEESVESAPASKENVDASASVQDEPEQSVIPNLELSYDDSIPTNNRLEIGEFNHNEDGSLSSSPYLMADKSENNLTVDDSTHSTIGGQPSAWNNTIIESLRGAVNVQPLSSIDTSFSFKENGAGQSLLDKKQYISMWHLVCQHVISSVATKLGSELLEEDEAAEDTNKSTAMEAPGAFKVTLEEDGREVTNQKAEFSRIQVLKLVKEAVQEILGPDIQDDNSDTLSVSSEIPLESELSDKDQKNGEQQATLDSVGVAELNSRRLDLSEELPSLLEDKGPTTNVITAETGKKLESMDKRISAHQKSKNWSKLKKLILLKRSIKAMEKARQLKFLPNQLLPVSVDQVPEKVSLRHEMSNERNKAHQWMLDYAVQHIVTTLTPARKRRVAMLIEAFEAVVPLPED